MNAFVRRAVLAALVLGLAACTAPRNREPAVAAATPPPSGPAEQLVLLDPAALPKGPMQCVPYARLASGIGIRGDAWTWWGQADDAAYLRGQLPRVGAVLVFKRTNRLRRGHVSVVARVVSAREILVTHANWATRGKVVHDVRVIDESAGNNWTKVKVWNTRTGKFGSSYPTYGFIYRPPAAQPAVIAAPPAEQTLYQP
jgi:hypothetical protein